MKTDTSEKGLESLIMRHLTGTDGLAPTTIDHLADAPAPIGGSGWIAGYAAGDDRAHATDGESRQFNFHGQHKMKTDLIQSLTYTFEAHAQQTEGGVEFWLARDLQHLLGYTEWRNFTAVISKAKTACEVSQHAIPDHFVDVNKMVDLGSGGQREVEEIMLSR